MITRIHLKAYCSTSEGPLDNGARIKPLSHFGSGTNGIAQAIQSSAPFAGLPTGTSMTFNGPVYINTTGSELTGVANKPCPPTDCAKLQDDTISSGSQRQTRFSSVATSNASQTSEAMPTAEQAIAEWPWPNGNISADIQAGSLLELQCEWAWRNTGAKLRLGNNGEKVWTQIYRCQGVIECDRCERADKIMSGPVKNVETLGMLDMCPSCRSGTLRPVSCTASMRMLRKTQGSRNCTFQHKGEHKHRRHPPERIQPSTQAHLHQKLRAQPGVKPEAIKTGLVPDPTNDFGPAISELVPGSAVFSNPARYNYQVKKLRDANPDLLNSSCKAILDDNELMKLKQICQERGVTCADQITADHGRQVRLSAFLKAVV